MVKTGLVKKGFELPEPEAFSSFPRPEHLPASQQRVKGEDVLENPKNRCLAFVDLHSQF